jgi:hypothetical protein
MTLTEQPVSDPWGLETREQISSGVKAGDREYEAPEPHQVHSYREDTG